MKRLPFAVWLFCAVLVAACGPQGELAGTVSSDAGRAGEEVAVGGESYVRVTPEELWRMMERKDPVPVNVHVPYEGEIPGRSLRVLLRRRTRRATSTACPRRGGSYSTARAVP